MAVAGREPLDDRRRDDDGADQHVHARSLHRLRHLDGLLVDACEERAAREDLLPARRNDPAEEHARSTAAAEPVRAEERRQVRVEGSGARLREEALPATGRRPGLQPAARLAAGDADARREHRQALQVDRPAEAPTGRRERARRETAVARDPARRSLHRRVLHTRGRRSVDRVGAADLEHDPTVDLLAATRDRGDEARRERRTGSSAARSCSREFSAGSPARCSRSSSS